MALARSSGVPTRPKGIAATKLRIISRFENSWSMANAKAPAATSSFRSNVLIPYASPVLARRILDLTTSIRGDTLHTD
jgi:hypothetical protein